jgi:Plasmid encoded RepA protein
MTDKNLDVVERAKRAAAQALAKSSPAAAAKNESEKADAIKAPAEGEQWQKNYPTDAKPSGANQQALDIDYRKGSTPAWVREVIAEGMAIEAEDVKSAGKLGFMTRALVQATLPYRDPKTDVFKRQNGDFQLRILAGYEGGVPYGIYPRLLMSWVTTEAVKTQNPEIQLGNSLSAMLREVLEVRTSTGGTRGTRTLVSEQMKRLFGSMISAQYNGEKARGFNLRNILIAEAVDLTEEDMNRLDGVQGNIAPNALAVQNGAAGDLWIPQAVEEAGRWNSKLRLTDSFFRECVEHPVPIDLRAFMVLRGSPMAMDIYTWLTYRMSYTTKASRLIRWELLQGQFGSGIATNQRGKWNFKRDFLKNLELVKLVYPQANLKIDENGVFLLPSAPHVPLIKQKGLF